jgi:hypothetical protein
MKHGFSWALAGWCIVMAGCGPAGNGTTVQAYPTNLPMSERHLSFNGQPLAPTDYSALESLEGQRGAQLPDGDFWYDPRSGAIGYWGGPILEFVMAGLQLGAPLPPNASGGGTSVFLNGREVHPTDLVRISQLVGRDVPVGRYWMDAEGNAGPEGGGTLLNIFDEIIRQQGAVPRLGAGTPDNPAPRP